MQSFFTLDTQATPVELLTQKSLDTYLAQQSSFIQNWVKAHKFHANTGQVLLVPDADGKIDRVLLGLGHDFDLWAVGELPKKCPQGIYQIVTALEDQQKHMAYMAWGYGCYHFDYYLKHEHAVPQLSIESTFEPFHRELAETGRFVRDLVNRPANDMGPGELAEATEKLAHTFGATFKQWIDEELLEHNFPMIYAVGEGSDRAPRLLEIQYGDPKHFKLTLVGKGVCFDTGGLDLKNSANMALQKKDMGGAAHVLGLARLIMATQLPICLRVLIPAVENSVSGSSYRPGDILIARNRKSVEITNTDAEGRLVLADALTEACTQKPDLLIDIATLTGAARVALGPEVAVMLTDHEKVGAGLLEAGKTVQDLLCQLPLHKEYKRYLHSAIANIVNSASSGFAGAITAALFLQEFVDHKTPWVHFDIMAYHPDKMPGREKGAGMQAIRAIYQYLLGICN